MKRSTREFFWGKGNVLCLGWGGGYARAHFHQSSSQSTFTCVHLSSQLGRHRCMRGVCGCHRGLEAERMVCLPQVLHSGSSVFAGEWFQDPAPQGYQSLLMILVSGVGPQHLWMWDTWTPPANWTRFCCHHVQILCSVSLFAATPQTVLVRPPHRLGERAIP